MHPCVLLVSQDEADIGPVREIDLSTFDERSSRQRQRLPEPTSACSAAAAHSRTELTNGTTTEGTCVPCHRLVQTQAINGTMDTQVPLYWWWPWQSLWIWTGPCCSVVHLYSAALTATDGWCDYITDNITDFVQLVCSSSDHLCSSFVALLVLPQMQTSCRPLAGVVHRMESLQLFVHQNLLGAR